MRRRLVLVCTVVMLLFITSIPALAEGTGGSSREHGGETGENEQYYYQQTEQKREDTEPIKFDHRKSSIKATKKYEQINIKTEELRIQNQWNLIHIFEYMGENLNDNIRFFYNGFSHIAAKIGDIINGSRDVFKEILDTVVSFLFHEEKHRYFDVDTKPIVDCVDALQSEFMSIDYVYIETTKHRKEDRISIHNRVQRVFFGMEKNRRYIIMKHTLF